MDAKYKLKRKLKWHYALMAIASMLLAATWIMVGYLNLTNPTASGWYIECIRIYAFFGLLPPMIIGGSIDKIVSRINSIKEPRTLHDIYFGDPLDY